MAMDDIERQLLLELRQELLDLREDMKVNTELTRKVLSAFPSEDVEGHRRYHQSVIEWRDLRNKMVREAFINMAKVGTLSAALMLLVVAWKAIKISLVQP